jgi:hypothetical protein
LNKDAKNLLTSSSLAKVQADQQAYEQAKSTQQTMMQTMMMSSQNGQNGMGGQQQNMPQMMMMLNQQIAAAKARVDQNNAAIESLAAAKDDSVAALKQSLRDVSAAKTKLTSAYNQYSAQYQAIQDVQAQQQAKEDQMRQAQMAAMMNPNQGTPNIRDQVTNSRNPGFGGQRTQIPQIGARQANPMNPLRGGLGSMAGSVPGFGMGGAR